MSSRWWLYPLLLCVVVGIGAALFVGYAVAVVWPSLPSLEVLTDYRPKIPLRIYSVEQQLIGEFGEERRALVRIADVPKPMRDAILAAEDERFYEHGGIDWTGVLRAALSNFASGGARQGASTITMQVARNFFLTKEKTFSRKFNEVLLAWKIERNLSKDQILELYLNQIYLGQRAYGFAAAAQIYYGKPLDRLSIAEVAMLAGLPKAPSRYNPVANPARARLRQQYVLRRMHELRMIDDAQLAAAKAVDPKPVRDTTGGGGHADHVTEMVRQTLFERYQDAAYTSGFRVHTTLRAAHQDAAWAAVRRGVLDYDRRHGYRGADGYVTLPADGNDEAIEELLGDEIDSDDIRPAVVLGAEPTAVRVHVRGIGGVDIGPAGLRFAQRMLGDNAPADRRLRRGAVVRVQPDGHGEWQIVQLPQVEAALVAIDTADGAVRALVGGFDYARNKFNHVTQAWRQPGSAFKPFVYSAALEKGFTAASVINDAPLSFDASETGSATWEPKNFDGTFEGPMRLRVALAKSKNLVSVRILQSIGTQYAQDYVTRFGFDPKMIPPYLTMALGAGSVTPWQMAGGYAVFANGGYRVTPYVIARVEDARGTVLSKAKPDVAPDTAPRVIDSRNAFVMTSLMQDVVQAGTASRARSLKRTDLAGKTGTTNDQLDAWFAGYQPRLAAVAWIGFDTPRSLGGQETGGAAALPIWIQYMAVALEGLAETEVVVPDGVTAAAIDPETGLRSERSPKRISEWFYQEFLPPEEDAAGTDGRPGNRDETENQVY
ncbi:MAG: penicillin-binding protein 1A [Burkholderiales bacterium]|jgi:penicillin-binding protein 1A|nr:penicillin-binding protein 1A [Burkholderiales bacterium]